MKNSLPLILTLVFLVGCNSARPVEKAAAKVDDTTVNSALNNPSASLRPAGNDAEAQKILGSYVGPFGDNKITLLITKVEGNAVSGRSIVGGNDRPFAGTFTAENAVYSITANEPGDHKDDGVFKFSVSPADPSKVAGTWRSNDGKRPERSYTLARLKFEYRPDVGTWPEGSTRALKTSEVENLGKNELSMMRNEIFARHGFCFSRKEMRQRFENEDWYVPDTVDIRGRLTDIEKTNIAMIKRYEKYAVEYGDEYGR
jgi:YARHG domain